MEINIIKPNFILLYLFLLLIEQSKAIYFIMPFQIIFSTIFGCQYECVGWPWSCS